MEKAIKRAIEGGYAEQAYCFNFDMFQSDEPYCHATVLLDPFFWQALGKADGWNKNVIKYLAMPISKEELLRMISKIQPIEDLKTIESVLRMDDEETWKYHMHRFIDHIAEGKNVDDFFNNLLK